LIEWKSVPPIAPKANAPPQSSTIRQGLFIIQKTNNRIHF
jgi:hypothetical protein